VSKILSLYPQLAHYRSIGWRLARAPRIHTRNIQSDESELKAHFA